MLLKEYNLIDYNRLKLLSEISLSNSVFEFSNLEVTGDTIQIYGQSILNESLLDSIISSHESITIEELRLDKIKEIDNKTQSLIKNGFIYDSYLFSLSEVAQINWLGIYQSAVSGLLSFPFPVTTKDDLEYLFNDVSDIQSFFLTGLGLKKYHIDSGRAIKQQIIDASTKEEIYNIEDTRG
jgi:hypothetical protein